MRVQGLGFSIWRYTPKHLRGLANMLELAIHKDIRVLALGLGRIGIYIMWYIEPKPELPQASD